MESTQQRGQTPVPVEVDPATGRRPVHEVPLLLVPRALLTIGLAGVEDARGEQAAGLLLARPGAAPPRGGAHMRRPRLGSGAGITEHYLDPMGRRG